VFTIDANIARLRAAPSLPLHNELMTGGPSSSACSTRLR
jgi:hypothetical protein